MQADRPDTWDEPSFQAALVRAQRDRIVEAPGVYLSAEQWQRLRQAASTEAGKSQRVVFRAADLRGASFAIGSDFSAISFESDAGFGGTTFQGDVSFHGTAFLGSAHFAGAKFTGDAHFSMASFPEYTDFSRSHFAKRVMLREVSFAGVVNFRQARFDGEADFGGIAVSGEAAFDSAEFRGPAAFREAEFQRAVEFPGAKFMQRANFDTARFRAADFSHVHFGGDANFKMATFTGNTTFRGATFAHRAIFHRGGVAGDMDLSTATFERETLVALEALWKRCDLSEALFKRRVVLKIAANVVQMHGTQFEHGGDIFLRTADISLEEADFAEASLLTSPEQLRPELFRTPRVVSMRRAKVAQLTISQLDLGACRFVGAHGLDQLRIEQCRFSQPPQRGHLFALRRWMRRLTIAEEHHLRREAKPGWRGWYEDDTKPPAWLEETDVAPAAGQIAAVYRALRKGREDSRDEPGAGDFYYGEMEMRRAAGRAPGRSEPRTTPIGERIVLWLYWMASGYGLSTVRALVAFAVMVLLASIPLAQGGLQPTSSYGHAVLFATESSISLLRAPEARLAASGQALDILLRLGGPLFFGLAILSLRNRVKR
jgi:uncharacterized protein YjbI with pentapeptide repeats